MAMNRFFNIIRKKDGRRGFTLVELLVAITLFSIAIGIAVGGFVRALRTQKQLVALISANSNASLGIEQMAREIRVGRNFTCGADCSELKFTNANQEQVDYALTRDVNGNMVLSRTVGNNTENVTADNVVIDNINFTIFNGGGQYPPRITISLGIGAKTPDLAGNVTYIQTTISSRAF